MYSWDILVALPEPYDNLTYFFEAKKVDDITVDLTTYDPSASSLILLDLNPSHDSEHVLLCVQLPRQPFKTPANLCST